MLQPEHLRPFRPTNSTPRRVISLGFVALFHIIVIYAFASGLAQQLAQKLPEELKAEIVPPKLPDVKPPPPPPPDLTKPPPPFVPPPEINIQTESPVTNTITVSKTPPPPAAVEKATGITAPASIGATHSCLERFYPPLAVRLNQEGTTLLAFHILPDGSVANATVAESSGHDDLDDAAVRCASTWRYKPAFQNGQPIEVPWKASVRWQLK
jgi:protein TonB